MLRRPRSDFWQVGIAPSPIATLAPSRLQALQGELAWMPPAGAWRYFADPFALRRGDTLHVFVEAFDYRTRHGTIERHDYLLPERRWRPGKTVLARPFHLSYPSVFEHEGAAFMVPESQQAGEIALYRGDASLDHWERVCALLPVRGVDASVVRHEGRWWMFYAVVGKAGLDRRELRAAHAPELTGPWTPCAGNPLRIDPAGARPAGSPFTGTDGKLWLPVQDCSATYGGALQLLRFDELTPERVRVAASGIRYTGGLVSSEFTEGFHTLSACGEHALFDVKRIDRSRARQWLDLKRRARRLAARLVGGARQPAAA